MFVQNRGVKPLLHPTNRIRLRGRDPIENELSILPHAIAVFPVLFIRNGSDTPQLAAAWSETGVVGIFRGAPASRWLSSASRRGLQRLRRDAEASTRDGCAPRTEENLRVALVLLNASGLAPGLFTLSSVEVGNFPFLTAAKSPRNVRS